MYVYLRNVHLYTLYLYNFSLSTHKIKRDPKKPTLFSHHTPRGSSFSSFNFQLLDKFDFYAMKVMLGWFAYNEAKSSAGLSYLVSTWSSSIEYLRFLDSRFSRSLSRLPLSFSELLLFVFFLLFFFDLFRFLFAFLLVEVTSDDDGGGSSAGWLFAWRFFRFIRLLS